MLRKVSASREAKDRIDSKGTIKISSDIPVDPYNCECKRAIVNRKKDEIKKRIECPRRNESKLKKYSIECKNCGAKVGDIHASDKKLTDWANFHYYCESRKVKGDDGKKIPDSYQWFGAMAVQVSQFDGKLGIECTCGQDTRDFRGNTTMHKTQLEEIISENMKGRDFGKLNSKFVLK